MMIESLDERLGWIKPDYYEKIDKDDSVIIKEAIKIDTKSVTAEIHFKFSGTALKFTPEKQKISFLKTYKDKKEGLNVGETIIFVINDNEVDIHIIECKTTVGFNTWRDIKNKFQGSLIYSLPFVGILNLSIRSIKFYTAYLNDDKMKVKPSKSPHPSSFKVDFVWEWKHDKVSVGSIKSAPHRKIQLILADGDKIEEARIKL